MCSFFRRQTINVLVFVSMRLLYRFFCHEALDYVVENNKELILKTIAKNVAKNGDEVGKDLFKLFNNAVFGKTMENLRKRINFEVVTSRKVWLKRITNYLSKHPCFFICR